MFPLGTTTVTVTATDTSGVSTSGTFTVSVQDIPPTLTVNGLPAEQHASPRERPLNAHRHGIGGLRLRRTPLA